MERTEIVSQILAILEDVAEISPEDVNENSVLMDDLDLSSMEILTVVADLEETFGLRIPEKELRNFVTVSDLADYLAREAAAVPPGAPPLPLEELFGRPEAVLEWLVDIVDTMGRYGRLQLVKHPAHGLTLVSLDRAVLAGYDNTIRHLLDQGIPIYFKTILGRNDMVRQIARNRKNA